MGMGGLLGITCKHEQVSVLRQLDARRQVMGSRGFHRQHLPSSSLQAPFLAAERRRSPPVRAGAAAALA